MCCLCNFSELDIRNDVRDESDDDEYESENLNTSDETEILCEW